MPVPLHLVSPASGKAYPLDDVCLLAYGDPAARVEGMHVNLIPVYPEGTFTREAFAAAFARRRDLWDFQALLPVGDDIEPVTIGEGNTPLIAIPSERGSLYLKDESRNATWSHKDRAMTVAVTVAQSRGYRTVVGASTGNAGAALAAYAARAGMHCVLFTGTDVPTTMQTFMGAYGALLCRLDGGANRRAIAALGIERYGWFPGTNVTDPPVGSNPYGIEGYTTIAYEIVRDRGDAPAAVVVPTSYGDNLTGIWRGFQRLHAAGVIAHLPRMIVAEPANSAPYAHALAHGGPEQVTATPSAAFSIGGGTASRQAWQTLRDADGDARSVAESDILPMQRRLASETGLYLEAASVVGVAVARRIAAETNGTVVVIGTSSGLKDPSSTARALPEPPTIPVDLDALARALESAYGVRLNDLDERR
ncbi:MAG: pyridoxal-phosphate dependent enzyme [Chloroflexota bacterium]|nr:pyridoxal-phosphate dependent enzyme [Chloroflexota bacterium]